MICIKKKCYIVGASPINSPIFPQINTHDIVIAADGGFDLLKKSSIKADILLGDFDSIDEIPVHDKIIRLPVEKDDTDTFFAYKMAFDMGYRNFVFYGGTGGRLDHTIANLQMLINIAKNNGRGFLIDKNFIITAINNGKISFSEKNSGTVSVFSFEKARGVNIEGLKYCLKDYTIEPHIPLGVSNEFIEKKATISVDNGSLLVFWNDSAENFEENIENFLI